MDITAPLPESEVPQSIDDPVVNGPEEGLEESKPEVQTEAPQPEEKEVPDISILDGLRVDLDGKMRDAEGVVVGELVEGDIALINRRNYTSNTMGEFRSRNKNKKWQIVGRARVVPVSGKEATEKELEETPFDISTLRGLSVRIDGSIESSTGDMVGCLVKEDMWHAMECCQMGYLCDAEGLVKDSRGMIVARAMTVTQKKDGPSV